MNDQDYIRKAIELADGWNLTESNAIVLPQPGEYFIDWPLLYLSDYPECTTIILDAIAAQLVRQARKTHQVNITNGHCYVFEKVNIDRNLSALKAVEKASSDDDTMNTIKAIVDSKVLE